MCSPPSPRASSYKDKDPELCAYLATGVLPGPAHTESNGVAAPRPAPPPAPTPRDAPPRNGAAPAVDSAGRRGPYSSEDAASAAPASAAVTKK